MKQIINNNFIMFYLIFSFLFTGCTGYMPQAKNENINSKISSPVKLDKKEKFGNDNFINQDNNLTCVDPLAEKTKNISENNNYKAKAEKPVSFSKIQKPEKRYFDYLFKPVNKQDLNPGDIVFNFDNADLYEVIRTMAELLNINYITDPNIRGSVTIHTSKKLRKEDLFTVFYQVLEANGLTAIQEGSLYRIMPLKDASRMPIVSKFGRKGTQLPPEDRVVMQIIPLDHISAEEMTKLLTPFVSADGTIISHGDSNTLLIVDKAINILKALKLIEAFDIDIFQGVKHCFYSLEYVDAEEMVKLLTDILSAYGKEDKKNIKLIAIKRINSILAISADSGVFVKLDKFIQEIDIPDEGAEPRIYVYSVKNGEAEELSTLLNTVFTGITDENKLNSVKKSEDEAKSKPVVSNPFAKKIEKSKSKDKKISKSIHGEQGSGTLKSDVKIIPDKIRNALIIEAIPSDYRIITDILKSIDVLPRQVLIEATIAEITLDKSSELGVEWSFDKSGPNDTGLLSANIGKDGLAYTIGLTEKWTNKLSALASKNKVNILSSPIILASDNKEAQINVSKKIPIPTTEYQYETDTQPIFQTTIQYRDTGLILSVTPHINERGLVSMDISQEISEEGGGIDVGGKNYATFSERLVKTTLTVKNGQTIVLGGLMQETRDSGGSGVPFLRDIPLLGYVFGKKSNSFIKNELIILLTPRVIITHDDIDSVTEEFQRKVANIKEKLG